MFFIGALAALGVACYFGYRALQEHHNAKPMPLTQTGSTGRVRELHEAAKDAAGVGAFSQPVELDGTAEVGPTGLLTSPLSGTKCVWHMHRITDRYIDITRDSEGRMQESEKTLVATEESTRAPFLLHDSEGDITIVPTTHVQGAQKTLSESRDMAQDQRSVKLGKIQVDLPDRNHDGEIIGREFEEWVLKPGTRLFVSGEATDRRGELVVTKARDTETKLVMSTRDEEDEIASHRSKMWQNIAIAAGLVALSIAALVYGLSGSA